MKAEDYFDWEWAQQHASDCRPRALSQFLRARMASAPDDIMVSAGDRTLTVEEFARRVAAVAAHLRSDSDERPVVVIVDRSVQSAAALHGVMWSGRCLVPVSVDEPASRLMSIVSRLGSCVITDATGAGPRTLGNDDVRDLTTVREAWIDPVPVPATDRSLIIFTSGSTGHPKGIIRRGWQSDAGSAMSTKDGGRGAVFGPLHWLGGLGGLNRTVFNGSARLIETCERDPKDILDEMRVHEVTRLSGTPSLITALARSTSGRSRVPTLREVVLSGESATWETIEAARRLSDQPVTVRVMYGASESILGIATHVVNSDRPLESGRLSLGEIRGDHVDLEPLGNSDENLFEVIVRRWVAAGYVDGSESQTSRFGIDEVGDPYWRSGDLVHVDEHGTLWSAGRIDDVVKISGKLVSPSEAAAVLSSTPGVRRSVVLPRTLESGKKQLVAHVEADADVDPLDVRRRLAEQLPAHLIPAVFVRHDELPLAKGGKVDRRLLVGATLRPWRSGSVIEPRSELERFIVEQASAMLGISDLGVNDDLWSFGLDSLSAIELTEVLAEAVGVRVDVNDFVGASTPADISALLNGGILTNHEPLLDFGRGDRECPVIAVPGAGSPAVTLRHLASELAPMWHAFGVEPRYVMQNPGDVSVSSVAVRSVQAMREVFPHGPYRLVGYSWGGLVAHEMAVILRSEGADVRVVLLDTPNPTCARDRAAPVIGVSVTGRNLRRARRLVHPTAVLVRQFIGPGKQFWRRFRVTVRAARDHRPRVFGGPMLLIESEQSRSGATWRQEPNMMVRHVASSHDDLILVPSVSEVGVLIADFFLHDQHVSGSSVLVSSGSERNPGTA